MNLDAALVASLAFGVAGIAVGVVAVVHSRQQAHASRLQAEQAGRVAEIESSRRMLDEFRALRRQRFTDPTLLTEARAASPEIVPLLDADGGAASFLINCDTLDTFQEVFFLRRRGIVSDEHWALWTQMHMLGPVKLPGFRAVWEASLKHEWLDPDFAAFYAPAFRDAPLRDPLRVSPTP
jgi:hypothetical protein